MKSKIEMYPFSDCFFGFWAPSTRHFTRNALILLTDWWIDWYYRYLQTLYFVEYIGTWIHTYDTFINTSELTSQVSFYVTVSNFKKPWNKKKFCLGFFYSLLELFSDDEACFRCTIGCAICVKMFKFHDFSWNSHCLASVHYQITKILKKNWC